MKKIKLTEKQELLLRNNNGKFPKVRNLKLEAINQLGRAFKGLK